MKWDPKGDRLAVALGQGSSDGGKVALYSTSCQPVVSVRLIGKISVCAEDTPVQALEFHPKYKGGALLSIVSQSRQIFTVPLLYSPTAV